MTNFSANPHNILFNPFSADFKNNPYPIYHHLRQQDPVHASFLNAWVLTRYKDVKMVLRDSQFCTNKIYERLKDKAKFLQDEDFDVLQQISSKFLFFIDPPQHTILRELIYPVFSSFINENLQAIVTDIVNELIDEKIDAEEMDIISDFAEKLPVRIIGQILGIPPQDNEELNIWSKNLSLFLDPLLSLEDYQKLNKVCIQFRDYLQTLINKRKEKPENDLISALIHVAQKDNRLDHESLLSTLLMLFTTGEETTVNLVGNGILALLLNPEQMNQLKSNPEIIASAVEELLRYDSPVQQTAKVSLKTFELEDKVINEGDVVIISFGAANRDPSVFEKPDQLNFDRQKNEHLAFGGGIHYCLGARLARLQGKIAINTILKRLSNLQLAQENLQRRKNIALRGLKSLPVTFNK